MPSSAIERILFVCSANKDRSATACDYFSEKFPQLQFDGAGTNHKICFQEGTTALLESHVHWADLILVMEQKHKKAVEAITSSKVSSKIRVLQIPDHYVYYNEALIQILNEKVVPYLTL